jgi:hypothetical protein
MDDVNITIIYDRKKHYGVKLRVIPLGVFVKKVPKLERIQQIIFRCSCGERVSIERDEPFFGIYKSTKCGVDYVKSLINTIRVLSVQELEYLIKHYYW